MVKTKKVLKEVYAERVAQESKWGQQNHHPVEYFAILAEEFGEVAKEVVEHNFCGDVVIKNKRLKAMREELIQTAAVAVAMVECLDRNNDS